MRNSIKKASNYLLIVLTLLYIYISVLLIDSQISVDLGIQLFLGTTLFLTSIERPSDVIYFSHTELKCIFKYIYALFHWELRISKFSFILQSLSYVLILINLLAILLINKENIYMD